MPNGRNPDTQPTPPSDLQALRARLRELETLCAEVYVEAVELGLPQPLLNRLWTVAAQGSAPHAYHLDMPPKPAAAATAGRSENAAATPRPPRADIPLPDVRLTDKPGRPSEARANGTAPALQPIAERRTVLVVDDDLMMLDVLQRILQRENYELLTAASGSDALEKAAAHPTKIDLLITDFAMPEMKGHELADRLRQRDQSIKVLYQTGFSDLLFENRVELEDGSAFVEKPFTARGLREAARLILFGTLNPA